MSKKKKKEKPKKPKGPDVSTQEETTNPDPKPPKP